MEIYVLGNFVHRWLPFALSAAKVGGKATLAVGIKRWRDEDIAYSWEKMILVLTTSSVKAKRLTIWFGEKRFCGDYSENEERSKLDVHISKLSRKQLRTSFTHRQNFLENDNDRHYAEETDGRLGKRHLRHHASTLLIEQLSNVDRGLSDSRYSSSSCHPLILPFTICERGMQQGDTAMTYHCNNLMSIEESSLKFNDMKIENWNT